MNTARRGISLQRWRRGGMVAVVLVGALQFFGWPIFGGSLTGSSILDLLTLIDPFAALESMTAAHAISLPALVSLAPIFLGALLVGRAFCGWVCPMDGLFSLAGRLRRAPPPIRSFRYGWLFAGGLLLAAALAGIPFYSVWFSHLTNLFRLPAALLGVLRAGGEGGWFVVLWSAGAIVALLALDLVAPRLWCRSLCPSGWVYGWFNSISRLRLGMVRRPCTRCHGCNQSCYMGVEVEGRIALGEIRDHDCIMCGRCSDACHDQSGPIRLTFTKPLTDKESS